MIKGNTIVKALSQMTDEEFLQLNEIDEMKIGIKCNRCKDTVIVVLGTIKNEDFVLIREDHLDPLRNVCRYRCPNCKRHHRVKVNKMSVLNNFGIKES